MDIYSFVLPWPPTINHYYRMARNRMYITKRGKQYITEVKVLLLPFIRRGSLSGPLFMEIEAYPPDRRRRDIDNIQKCLLDSIEKSGLIENDNQIHKLTTQKFPPDGDSRVEITIGKFDGDPTSTVSGSGDRSDV